MGGISGTAKNVAQIAEARRFIGVGESVHYEAIGDVDHF